MERLGTGPAWSDRTQTWSWPVAELKPEPKFSNELVTVRVARNFTSFKCKWFTRTKPENFGYLGSGQVRVETQVFSSHSGHDPIRVMIWFGSTWTNIGPPNRFKNISWSKSNQVVSNSVSLYMKFKKAIHFRCQRRTFQPLYAFWRGLRNDDLGS